MKHLKKIGAYLPTLSTSVLQKPHLEISFYLPRIDLKFQPDHTT